MSNPYETAKANKSSVLGPTLKFKGELSAEEDLLIQGEIEGSIKHTSNLTIGEDGRINASVSAKHINIEGTVDGDLQGADSVVVRDTATVQGNIFSPSVSLYEGATFNGTIDMSGNTSAKSAKPPAEKRSEQAAKAEHGDSGKSASKANQKDAQKDGQKGGQSDDEASAA